MSIEHLKPAVLARNEPEPRKPPKQGANGRVHWRPVVVQMSTVTPEPVTWLWRGRVARRKINLFVGDPGQGKSTLALELAASVSNRKLLPDDDGQQEPENVLLLSGEDGLADTMHHRLTAAGADLQNVFAITVKETTTEDGETIEGSITLKDVDTLEQAIRKYRPGLVVIDTLAEYLGADVDSHKSNETRPVLSRLGKLAETYNFALVIIHHTNKSSAQRAIHRIAGSYDFVAVARSVLLVAEDPQDPTLRVLAQIKSNLGPLAPSLSFQLDGGAIQWLGQHAATAQDLLALPATPEVKLQRDEARDLLRELLADGPIPVQDIKTAARDADIGWRTVQETKKALNIEKRRVSEGNEGGGRWEWYLPSIP